MGFVLRRVCREAVCGLWRVVRSGSWGPNGYAVVGDMRLAFCGMIWRLPG